MKIVQLEQGSPEWHEWRSSRTCSTCIGTILGVNPYKSIHKLYREKMGVESSGFTSYAAQRGTDLEPKAREWAEFRTGMAFQPICVEREDNPRHAASLDGYDYLSDVLLEIKCLGPANHEKLLSGDIPEQYSLQIQWALYCTQAKYAILCAFDGEEGHLIEIHPSGIIEEVMPKILEFERCLDTFSPPEKKPRNKKASVI